MNVVGILSPIVSRIFNQPYLSIPFSWLISGFPSPMLDTSREVPLGASGMTLRKRHFPKSTLQFPPS